MKRKRFSEAEHSRPLLDTATLTKVCHEYVPAPLLILENLMESKSKSAKSKREMCMTLYDELRKGQGEKEEDERHEWETKIADNGSFYQQKFAGILTDTGALSQRYLDNEKKKFPFISSSKAYLIKNFETLFGVPWKKPLRNQEPCDQDCDPTLMLNRIGAGAHGLVYTPLDKRCHGFCESKSGCVIKKGTREHLRVNALLQELGDVAPRIHKYIRCNGTLFAIMDKISGLNIDDWLIRKYYEGDQKAITAMWENVLQKMMKYHQKGLIHNDLNPGNILIDAKNNPWFLDWDKALIGDSENQVRDVDWVLQSALVRGPVRKMFESYKKALQEKGHGMIL